MAIGMAQQRGSVVYVYDENNRQLWAKDGELYGYTSGNVTIKIGSILYMYDEKGMQVGARSCY